MKFCIDSSFFFFVNTGSLKLNLKKNKLSNSQWAGTHFELVAVFSVLLRTTRGVDYITS